MLTPTTPCNLPLGNGLVLKSVRDTNDAERLSEFNAQPFGPSVGEMSRALMIHHPDTRPHHWLFIEDDNHQIISSLALIPWTWRYEDVTLKSGEMGIVSTLETHRNKGLIRALDARFKELLHDEDFDFSHIQGIPYFYRQFGYEYAMPLEGQWQIELRHVPDQVPNSGYICRAATIDDIPLLMQMYDEAAATLDIHAVRSADIWRYLLEDAAGSETEAETWLMLDSSDHAVGYWRIALHGFGEGLIVSDTSRLRHAAAEVLLSWLKAAAVERNKPYIRFNLPANHDLLRVAMYRGARDAGTYAWQLHMVDVACLLKKLTPVLERRIAASPFAGLSQEVIINLYRKAVTLNFERSKLRAVNDIGFTDKGEIHIPPLLFAPLVLGYRSREELRQAYPDVNIWGQSQHLVDVLFPKLESFLFSIY
jgi:predicted N-acetyltransferase YhbS